MTARRRRAARLRDRYGPWAIVTGASEGIGLAFARELAANGLHLVLVARRRDRLERQACELSSAHGVEVLPVALDLAQPSATEDLVAATSKLDVGLLVAAAGFGTSGPILEASRQSELEMIDVNCRTVTAQLLAISPRLVQRGRGGIVLMSSLLAFQGVPRAANYAATKAYIQTLAEGLRWELAPHGVDVVASAPGPIHSGFAMRAGMHMAMGQTPEVVSAGTLAALGRRLTVRPGWLSKVLAGSLTSLPRAARVRIMAMVMAGMTRQRDGKGFKEGSRPA
jgi:short-subunit dehydrogenase